MYKGSINFPFFMPEFLSGIPIKQKKHCYKTMLLYKF